MICRSRRLSAAPSDCFNEAPESEYLLKFQQVLNIQHVASWCQVRVKK
jgi:hypothetical protein